MMRTNRGYQLICSGRSFYANGGIIGINESGRVTEGYDGHIDGLSSEDDDVSTWTVAERQELADSMIALWAAFKAQVR